MADQLILKAKGLQTDPNQLSHVEDGAMTVADNVLITRTGVVESRPGFTPIHNASTFAYQAFGADTLDYARAITSYQGHLLVNTNDSKLYYHDTTGGWTQISGTYIAPTTNTYYRMKFAEANGNLYFTTSAGVYVLDAYNGTPRAAGMPPALGTFAATTMSTATGAWIVVASTANQYAAYRACYGFKDANNNIVLGAPASRIVMDTGGTANTYKPVLSLAAPKGLPATAFIQLYRSATGTTYPPSDELAQVYERYPVGTSGYDVNDIADVTTDNLRGAFLYTNQNTGEGILASNYPPPLCKDLCLYKGYMLYANTTEKHRKELQLLSVGTTAGVGSLTDGDTLTVGPYTIAFVAEGATPYVPTASYNIITCPLNTSSSSTTTNLEKTCQRLVQEVNAFTNNTTIHAFYTSTANDLASGKVVFEEAYVGASAFNVNASGLKDSTSGKMEAWRETLPRKVFIPTKDMNTTSPKANVGIVRSGTTVTVVTPCDNHGFTVGQQIVLGAINAHADFAAGTKTIATVPSADSFTYTEAGNATDLRNVEFYAYTAYVSGTDLSTAASTNSNAPNCIAVSKFQQPEHVPLVNRIYVGAKNTNILRILPLKDSVFVFKEEGIYRITGETLETFRVDEFDLTTRLIGPDSPATLGNQIYCFTNQGIVAVSEGGVQIVSKPIENLLKEDVIYDYGRSDRGFGLGDEVRRIYVYFPFYNGTTPYYAFVYNYITKSWTTWGRESAAANFTAPCGYVMPSTGSVTQGLSKIILGSTLSGVGLNFNILMTEHPAAFTATSRYDKHRLYTTTTTSASTNSIVLTSVSHLSVGDYIWYNGSNYSRVTAIDGTTVTLATAIAVAAGTVYGLEAIEKNVSWAVAHGAQPQQLKHWRECALFTQGSNFSTCTTSFESELSPGSPESVTITKTTGENGPERTYVPTPAARCSQLTVSVAHDVALEDFTISGLGLTYNTNGGKVK